MRETRSRFRRRVHQASAAAVIAVAAATSLVPVVGAQAAAPKPLFELAGTLERFPADARSALGSQLVPDPSTAERARMGTAIIIPEARQLWQLYAALVGATVLTGAVVRDLDTLRISRTVQFPNVWFDRATIHPTGGGDWAHAVDTTGTRLFLLQDGHQNVFDIDLRTFAVKRWPLLASRSPSSGLTPLVVGGMTYDPFEDDLLVLYGGPPANSVADTNTFLLRLDVTGTPPAEFGANQLGRLSQLQSCSGPLSSVDAGGDTYNWELLVTKDLLYIPCHRAGNAAAVVRMRRPSTAEPRPREDVVVGPVYAETVMADQASGRLFVATTRREVWVFETITMSFVGIVATGVDNTDLLTGYGLDRKTGRLFFQSKTFGLGVAEGRFFPIPQARTMPRRVSGQERILSDAQTGRVFVLEGDGKTSSKAMAYRIYKTGASPVPPAPPDPDRNTTDMAEREGVTEARYFASGSGYGTRALLAKGVSTVPPAPTVGLIAPTAQAIDKNVNSKCGYTDRELVAGRVGKAEYDTGSTAASAIAVDVDVATKQDLDQPSRCDIKAGTFGGLFSTEPAQQQKLAEKTEPSEEEGTRWKRGPAVCASSEGTGQTEGQGAEDDLGPSAVICPRPGGTLTAEATTSLTGAIEVDRTWTKTTVEGTSAGVKSTVEAVAQGVSIAGVIHFGEIRSVATSVSNGRPKADPMSTHDVSVREAQIGETVLCQICSDLTALETALNTAAGGKAVFRTGEGQNSGLDEKLKQGSPRGALTAVQKSAARQASDRVLVGDFTTELPGLEMTVFNDNVEWGRARQLYQFAGVSTAATYNIVLRPIGLPFAGDDGRLDDELPIADIGSTPFPGFAESTSDGITLGPAAPAVNDGNDNGGGILAPLRALARGIRLFFTNPRQGLLLLTTWALLSLPAVLSRRRRLLTDV